MINGVDTHGLKKFIGKVKENEQFGFCQFRVTNEWIDGDANRAEASTFYAGGGEQKHKKTFHFQAGEPTLVMGKDEGANPVEFLLSGLSACMTTTIAYYAALNGHPIEEMNSTLEGDLNLQGLFGLNPNIRPGYQTIRANFKIKTDASEEEIRSYYPFSPVYDVVSKSVPIDVTIETYQ